jgi:hypothetical protein
MAHPSGGQKAAIETEGRHQGAALGLVDRPDLVTRFFNETRAIHMIGHENVVEILDSGQTAWGRPAAS